MKFFVIFCLVAVPLIVATPTPGVNSNKEAESAAEVEVSSSSQAAAADLTRERKSASYGGSAPAAPSGYSAISMPAPPCPKNYLFSCQPNLVPVPCAAPSAGYGGAAAAAASGYASSGAYSAPVPTYISPLNYAQQQAYGYPNQFYQY